MQSTLGSASLRQPQELGGTAMGPARAQHSRLHASPHPLAGVPGSTASQLRGWGERDLDADLLGDAVFPGRCGGAVDACWSLSASLQGTDVGS